VYRSIDRESESQGIEIRWAGEVWCNLNFVLDRYHKRFLLIYVYEGSCLYYDEDRFVRLPAGNLFLYKPHQRQYYKTDDPKFHYYGLSFSGKLIEDVMARMPLTQKNIHDVGINSYLARSITNLIKQMMLVPVSRSEIIWGEFFRILGFLNGLIDNRLDSNNENLHHIVQLKNAERYITLNYNADLKIEEIARISGYSISWFEKLFRKYYGMSPLSYQMKLRVEKAQDMIRTDILNISEISTSVGFNDPLYFSKVFKRYVGLCPKKYRTLQQA
jgi:AraC-like DNA-binding protein